MRGKTMSNGDGIYFLEGTDDRYKCKLKTNALSELENHLGKGIIEIADEFQQGRVSFKTIRALVWASMLWQDPDLTPFEAGEIVDDIVDEMGWEDMMMEMVEALRTWLPEEDELDEADIKNKMRKRVSSSKRSTKTS